MRYPAHVAVGDSSDVLRRILEPDINLVIWRRRLDPELKEAVRAIVTLPIQKRLDPVERFPGTTPWRQFFIDMPSEFRGLQARPLSDDLRKCLELFRSIVRPEHITLSVRREAPRKTWTEDWHPDTLRYRSICNYHGDPTLWLANGDSYPDEPKSDYYVRRSGRPVWRFPLGAVCFFKGRDPANTCPPLIHSGPYGRSARLLGVIND